jgi:hypothetical protein
MDADQSTDLDRFGIYAQNQPYWIPVGRGSYTSVSNFIMRPIMLAIDHDSSQRIIELINYKQHKVTVVLNSDDFVDLKAFRKKIERYGSFIYRGDERSYMKVKELLYSHGD